MNNKVTLIIGVSIIGILLVTFCCICSVIFWASINSRPTVEEFNRFDEVSFEVEVLSVDVTEDEIILELEIVNTGEFLAVPGAYMYLEAQNSLYEKSSNYSVKTQNLKPTEQDFDWEFVNVDERAVGFLTFKEPINFGPGTTLKLIVLDEDNEVVQRINISRG